MPGKCGACFRGTPAMSKAINALGLGSIDDAGLAKLQDWSVSLRGRGACATLDGAAHLAATIFGEFPEEIARHRHPCPRCAGIAAAGRDVRGSRQRRRAESRAFGVTKLGLEQAKKAPREAKWRTTMYGASHPKLVERRSLLALPPPPRKPAARSPARRRRSRQGR